MEYNFRRQSKNPLVVPELMGITNINRIHPLVSKDVCTKLNGYPLVSYNISLWSRATGQLSDGPNEKHCYPQSLGTSMAENKPVLNSHNNKKMFVCFIVQVHILFCRLFKLLIFPISELHIFHFITFCQEKSHVHSVKPIRPFDAINEVRLSLISHNC